MPSHVFIWQNSLSDMKQDERDGRGMQLRATGRIQTLGSSSVDSLPTELPGAPLSPLLKPIRLSSKCSMQSVSHHSYLL